MEQHPSVAPAAVPTRVVVFTIGALLALRLCFDVFAAPLPDEAYYWLWGQHLALSYYDHPPLNAWLQRIAAAMFGWNIFSLRIVTWLTTAGMAIVIWQRTRQLGPEYVSGTTALFFATPIVFIFSTLAFPDHLVIFLVLLSAHWFARYVESGNGPDQRTAWLYGAAIALGFAGLAKYNAFLVGLGVAAAVLATPELRRLLRDPNIYGAAAVAILMQWPVFYWNATNGMPSFRYNLADRLSWLGIDGLSNVALLALALTATVGPMLLTPLYRFLGAAWRRDATDALWTPLGFWVYGLTTAVFTGLCFFSFVQYYWTIGAYPIFLTIALAFFRSRRAVASHLIYGLVCATLFTANYTIVPLSALAGRTDAESALMFGWDEIARRVVAASARTNAGLVAASDYRMAAQLAFAIRDPAVQAISARQDQFDFWLQDGGGRQGAVAIILTDDRYPLNDDVNARFASIELIETFTIERFGLRLKQYRLYRGSSFISKGRTPLAAPQASAIAFP